MKFAKKMVIAAAVLPIALGSASAYAFGGKDGGRDGKGFHNKCGGGFDKKIFKKLDLTEEQKTQLKEMREAERENRKANKGDMSAKFAERQAQQEKVQALLLADTFDQAQAQALAADMVEKQTERRLQKLEKQHQMLSVLTAEQKAQLVELQKERAEKCQTRMQERMDKQDSE
ncbi:CpxP family protein [Vibrio sp. SCSIO 43136]|uniref:CpxP family protein n=1 Tax=Vibrio sp. SCSIO 43136 TaxID=2819101 RepID=UPI00207618EA|nr:CpxP family protein [Vibrio sp. SCSIO 43136]USD65462.1 CpxP family protein [Vibrio sp. SCSIO 43136]